MSTDLPFMMPTDEQFCHIMKRLGIKKNEKVVCYDSGSMQFFGYRFAWMLQAMGHSSVMVLDGGLPKWEKDGLPLESSPACNEADFDYKLDPAKIKTLEQIKAYAPDQFLLLDVRNADQFQAGNIEGSTNFPVMGNLFDGNTKCTKTQEERKAACEQAGIDITKDITVYCMSGVQASVAYENL